MTTLTITKTLFVIIVFLLIYAVIYYYTTPRKEMQIIQAPISKIDVNTLLERYPILISQPLANPEELINTLFKYTYTAKEFKEITDKEHLLQSRYKYIAIYNYKDDPIEVNVVQPWSATSPELFPCSGGMYRLFDFRRPNLILSSTPFKDSTVSYITIKIKKQQTLILPTGWIFHTSGNIRAICLHDPLSYALR